MTTGFRMHNVSDIKIQKVSHNGCQWFSVSCTDKNGNELDITLFTTNEDTNLEVLPDDKG